MPNRSRLGHNEERFRRYRALLAPGTPLREGLDRIVHGRTGALVVLGNSPVVESISTGGFTIDAPFTPTALRELAKMDGGIVLNSDFDVIHTAGVHFVPSGSIPTIETGTRHRTADRITQQAHVPVVTVSASMSTIALFMEGLRYPIEPSAQIMSRADQALATLERYRSRLQDDSNALSALEFQDLVSVADLVQVAQRVQMVHRLTEEIEGYVEELGADGRLLALQLYELTSGVDQLSTLIESDYRTSQSPRLSFDALHTLSTGDLLDGDVVAATLGLPTDLAVHLSSRGLRQITQSTPLSMTLADRLIRHFGSLQQLIGAGPRELMEVEGVDLQRARAIRDGLARLSDQAQRGH